MSQQEFTMWTEFYKLYPFDNYHVHQRPAAMLAAVTGRVEIEKIAEWLKKPIGGGNKEFDSTDMSIIETLGGHPPGG